MVVIDLQEWFDNTDAAFYSTTGWEAFQCPSLDKGGLAPANTYPENRDSGFSNDTTANIVDMQAPRLAYVVNEALCPRGRLGLGVSGAAYTNPYHYVKASRVHESSETVLAAELWGTPALAKTSAQAGGGPNVSNSRRAVSGFVPGTSGATGGMDKAYTASNPAGFVAATTADLAADPFGNQSWLSAPPTTLDFVGRNHGSKKLGTVSGPNGPISGWDLRTTNFLYIDGHVESKNVAETVYPSNQWGSQFSSLIP